MLKIRPIQLEVFGKRAKREFARQIIERNSSADLTSHVPPDQLHDRVIMAVDAALQWGFHGPSQAERFVRLSLRHGPNFATEGWSKPVLHNPRFTVDQRLDALEAAADARAATV